MKKIFRDLKLVSLKGLCELILHLLPIVWVGFVATSCHNKSSDQTAPAEMKTYAVTGVVRELKQDGRTVIIRHETVPGYMDAMTMPFRVRDTNDLAGLAPGDEIVFRLLVTGDESWIDRVGKTGKSAPLPAPSAAAKTNSAPAVAGRHPLLDYQFTNEFGQPMSLGQLQREGKAIAYTFFFTRCPIPDYCPRLAKNFAEASAKIRSVPDAPTNWHFLSITIDPEFDTPAVLRGYGRLYQYDSNHWSFLTGPTNKIRELAELSGLPYEREGVANYTHGFRTLIIDSAGRLHKMFPIGGNLSDTIAEEILKAAATTNR